MSILALIIAVVFGYWLNRHILPMYRNMLNLLVARANGLLREGVPCVYLLQPQQGTVISQDGFWAGGMTPQVRIVIAYNKNGKLILDTAAWNKLVSWGSYTSADVLSPDPKKRSIKIRAYTFLVLSVRPEEFFETAWLGKLTPEYKELEYRQQLYDEITAST